MSSYERIAYTVVIWLAAVVLCILVIAEVRGEGYAWDQRDEVPADIRARYRNPDGSCVYCSIGMMGAAAGNPNMASILWSSEYGPACRGGSYPDRVKGDFDSRGLDAWHVEGGNTRPWLEWCWRNGRSAAVTLTPSHMQWMCGANESRSVIYVVDNNSPRQVDEWSVGSFMRQHQAHDGGWMVIAKGPRPAPWEGPKRIAWWKGSVGATVYGRAGYNPAAIRGIR